MLHHPELTVIIEQSNQTPEQDRTNEGQQKLMTINAPPN
jgi:hypothetical protein